MGSHSRLLEGAIFNVQALGDRKKSSALWLKYKLNINKTGIFAIHFYFLYFFNVNDEACIGVLRIQDFAILLSGYRILSILLPGIWDTWFNIFVTSRDIENLEKNIMGIFANL